MLILAAERGVASRRAEASAGTAPAWDVATVADALAAPLLTYDDGPGNRRHLAALALSRSAAGDLLVCFGEDVALPLLALGALRRRRRVFTIAHSLAPLKKLLLHRWLWGNQVAGLVVYNRLQEALACGRLGWPSARVHRVSFQADHRFFTPDGSGATEASGAVVSIGGEHRDYPTLIAACDGLAAELSMGSAWARVTRNVVALPDAMVNRRRSWDELRRLYQRAPVVVVPLLPCAFPAGISSALEAMACAAPVIVTRTDGMEGVLPEDVVCRVPAGDVGALRAAIAELRRDPVAARALGRRARAWVESHATLDLYAAKFAALVRTA